MEIKGDRGIELDTARLSSSKIPECPKKPIGMMTEDEDARGRKEGGKLSRYRLAQK